LGQTALAVIDELLDCWQEEQQQEAQLPVVGLQWPVIIINEANELQSWSDERSLRTLLNWFVAKQRSRCHVMLVTSDYYFPNWLSKSKWWVTAPALFIIYYHLYQSYYLA
jgi:hypothetical protein